MSDVKNIPPETEALISLFSSIKNIEIRPWDDTSENVGLSVFKNYPDKDTFIPARNKKGQKDSIAVIKIWYKRSEVVLMRKRKKVSLKIGIYKLSRYSLKSPFPNFADDDSPTKASLAESKASKQPFDLEEFSRYELHLDKLKIYDLKKGRRISPKGVIEEIYKEHLDTYKNLSFQMKVKMRERILELIDPTIEIFKKINYYLFGKKIKENEDFMIGILKPYSFKDLSDLELISEKPKIFGSEFPISYKTAGTISVLFTIIYLINYYFGHDILGIVILINSLTNSFFLAVMVGAILLIFDRLIPYIILFLINQLIKLKFSLMLLKISV